MSLQSSDFQRLFIDLKYIHILEDNRYINTFIWLKEIQGYGFFNEISNTHDLGKNHCIHLF